jgi:iron(III) transport system substrate-binding protein
MKNHLGMIRWSRSIAAVVLAAALAPVAAGSQSQSLVEQARKEGEVVFYSTMSVSVFEIFQRAAREKYPFINFHHIYLASSRQAARVMLEARSGKVQADVVGNSLEGMTYYRDQKIIGRYESPEAKALIEGSVDPERFWFGITTDFLVTAYNTRLITRAKGPKSYDEYLNPEFKGQMANNSSVPYPLTGMMSLRGAEQARAYVKRLEQQNVRPVEGYTHISNLLAAGEYPMAIFMQVSKIEELKKKGAPVDWLPGAPTFATLSTIGLVQNSPHPAAGRLLIDFFLSAEGQQALARAGKIPLRKNVKTPAKAIDDLIAGGNLHVVKLIGDYSEAMKAYQQLMGLKS